MDIYDNILLKSRYNEKYSGQICRENQNSNFIIHDAFTQIVLSMG